MKARENMKVNVQFLEHLYKCTTRIRRFLFMCAYKSASSHINTVYFVISPRNYLVIVSSRGTRLPIRPEANWNDFLGNWNYKQKSILEIRERHVIVQVCACAHVTCRERVTLVQLKSLLIFIDLCGTHWCEDSALIRTERGLAFISFHLTCVGCQVQGQATSATVVAC